MELQVIQEKLAKALSDVGRVASNKAGLPILNNILLRTDGARLLVAATNLEVAATQYIGAKITKPGSLTVPARLVSDFVHNLPKEPVDLRVTNNILHISCGSFSSTINGLQDEEFPELPVINEAESVIYTLSADDFKQAANQTIITASSDSTRPVLTGVYWHSHDGSLYLAATDGYRLTERRIMDVSTKINAIVPVSTLQEVLRTVTDAIDEIEVLFDDSQVRFRLGDAEITSRLIDGNFPDYRQLIPEKTNTSFTIRKDELLRVTRLAALFSKTIGGSITVEVDTDKKTVSIRSVASELGENSSELPVDIKGENGIVSLNSRYLLDALSVVSADELTFGFSGKLSPCVLQAARDTPDYKHIIMPLKS